MAQEQAPLADFLKGLKHNNFDLTGLINIVDNALAMTKEKLDEVAQKQDETNLGEFFKMQMTMGRITHLIDTCSHLVSSAYQSCLTLVRGLRSQ